MDLALQKGCDEAVSSLKSYMQPSYFPSAISIDDSVPTSLTAHLLLAHKV